MGHGTRRAKLISVHPADAASGRQPNEGQNRSGFHFVRNRKWQIGLIFLSLAVLTLLVVLDARQNKENTFRVFYFAAKAAVEGKDIYLSRAPGDQKFEYVYPPLFAFLTIPFLKLPVLAAARCWLVINVTLILSTLFLASREAVRCFKIPAGKWIVAEIGACALLLGVGEIKTELATGQTDTLVLLLFTLAFVCLRRKPVWAGLALGASINIKYQTVLALPYLLMRREWKAALSACLSTALFALVPVFRFGFAKNFQYLLRSFGGLGRFAGVSGQQAAATVPLTWIRSVSLTSALGRILESMSLSPALALILAAFVGVALLLLVESLYRRRGITLFSAGTFSSARAATPESLAAVEWAGLSVCWLLLGPEVSRRHMYALLFLHVVAVAFLISAASKKEKRLVVCGLVLFQLGVRLPPSTELFAPISFAWNWIGGPSICLLVYYLSLVVAALPGRNVLLVRR